MDGFLHFEKIYAFATIGFFFNRHKKEKKRKKENEKKGVQREREKKQVTELCTSK